MAKVDGSQCKMTAQSKTAISRCFSSGGPAVLEDFYHWLESALAGYPLGKEESNRVIMATAEAFSNAVQHGNRSNPQKKVEVEMILSGNGLTLRVGDEGDGSKPYPSRKSTLFDTSGRGWELMHKLADAVSIRLENGFFWVELSFKMPKEKREQLREKGGPKDAGKIRSGGRR